MFYYDTTLQFNSATLLYHGEATSLLTQKERAHKVGWWLRSPGDDKKYAGYVYSDGKVTEYGIDVRCFYAIRPALTIVNIGNFLIGDVFEIGKWEFKIISPNLAWLHKQDIGSNPFGNTSDYETSDVKQIVDEWYYKSLAEEMQK